MLVGAVGPLLTGDAVAEGVDDRGMTVWPGSQWAAMNG